MHQWLDFVKKRNEPLLLIRRGISWQVERVSVFARRSQLNGYSIDSIFKAAPEENILQLHVSCSLVSVFCKFMSKSVVLALVFGCEVWSPTLWEKHRPLRVCGNRVLWKICETKREKVTGYWRKLHSNSFMIFTPAHTLLLSSSSLSSSLIRIAVCRRMRWAGHMARIRRLWWENVKGWEYMEDLGMDVRIIITVSRVTHWNGWI
jgi:hypothetical protein